MSNCIYLCLIIINVYLTTTCVSLAKECGTKCVCGLISNNSSMKENCYISCLICVSNKMRLATKSNQNVITPACCRSLFPNWNGCPTKNTTFATQETTVCGGASGKVECTQCGNSCQSYCRCDIRGGCTLWNTASICCDVGMTANCYCDDWKCTPKCQCK